MSENHFDAELERLTELSVGKLLIADVFDQLAFDALKDHLWQKAEKLRHEANLSKQILQSIRSAASAIRSRAEYLPSAREQIHRANDFELMLDLLIACEIRQDRQPGTPRII